MINNLSEDKIETFSHMKELKKFASTAFFLGHYLKQCAPDQQSPPPKKKKKYSRHISTANLSIIVYLLIYLFLGGVMSISQMILECWS